VVGDDEEEVVEFVKSCEVVEEEEGLLNRTRTNDVASTQKSFKILFENQSSVAHHWSSFR